VPAIADVFDYVLNRCDGNGDVDIVVVILHVDVDLPVVDGDFDVLVFAVDLDKISVGILLEFFGDDFNER
jgi:hypothetical protein